MSSFLQRAWPVIAVGIGLFFGFAILRVGPLGLVAAVVAFGVVASPRRLAAVGSYLLGVGLVGTLLLVPRALTMTPCSPGVVQSCNGPCSASCISSATLPALLAYGTTFALGLALLHISLCPRRGR